MFLLILSFVISFVSSNISFNIYNNSVLDGKPSNIIPLNSLKYSIPYNNHPISAQCLGSILWPKSVDLYYFKCNFDKNLFGFVWIDDHLICAPNVYNPPLFGNWNLSWTSSAYNTRKSFIRIDLYSNSTSITNNVQYLPFSFSWSFNDDNTYNIINNTYLSNDISPSQQKRMIVENSLTYNTFSTWFYKNMLSIIRLPDSFGLTFGICSDTTHCLTSANVDTGQLWVGAHSYDHSYMEYNLSWNGYNFAYQYASVPANATYSNFFAQIKLLSTKTPLPFIGFSSRFYWTRNGNQTQINVTNGDMNCFMNINGYGLSQYFTVCSNMKNYVKTEDNYLFQFNSTENVIYFTTDTNINSVNDISSIISKLKDAEYTTYTKYGNYSNTKFAIQSGLMWNLIWSPEQSGPFAPVSRGWANDATLPDFVFIIFDWDNIFASYQFSLDAMDIAASNLISVIKSKTVYGFVPNVLSVQQNTIYISSDRTEPVIGSMVLYKMYEKYGNNIIWLVDLLFDDLYDWLDWFWRKRRCKPKNIICLGSDPNLPLQNITQQNTMQAARWESGLDNSPMYDGDLFNTTTHHMQLYDVGMSALFINELKRLIVLGKAINVSSNRINILNERYEFMVNATLNELWHDTMNIFVNKFSTNDSFYVHISPTSFYPLMSGEPTVKQAEMIVNNYLLSPDYFCISLTFPNDQQSDCYYGLPSISHNDPAFKSQDYWRGLTWGPMAQLVFWSLDEYVQQSDIVKNGQNALIKQMNAMMLNVWNARRHICENYSPSKSHTECTGDHFYHWGGLSGFLSLIHDYY